MEPQLKELVQKLTSSRSNLMMAALAVLIIFFGSYAMTGYLVGDADISVSGTDKITGETDSLEVPSEIRTFRDTGAEICTENGKPVIRMFSTTRCPHCTWGKEVFDSVAREYVDRGLIVAHHWELDIRDDALTQRNEGFVPDIELGEFRRISSGGVPTYSMGCAYMRLGNGYERQGDISAEKAEFRAVIEKLIADL